MLGPLETARFTVNVRYSPGKKYQAYTKSQNVIKHYRRVRASTRGYWSAVQLSRGYVGWNNYENAKTEILMMTGDSGGAR